MGGGGSGLTGPPSRWLILPQVKTKVVQTAFPSHPPFTLMHSRTHMLLFSCAANTLVWWNWISTSTQTQCFSWSVTACPSALPASPLQDNRQCGVYNSAYEGHWQSLSCESALPYICKKTPNDARRAEPLGESLHITPDLLGPLNGLFMSLLKKCIGG